jgi:hypothetical protein
MKRFLPLLIVFALFCTSTTYYKGRNLLIKQEEYPESNALYVFDSTEIFLKPDASGRSTSHNFIKIFTPTGAEKFAQAAFGYITLYDTVILKKAIVIKPDGKVIKVKKQDIEDIPMPAWQGSKFLIPNLRILKITFPEVQEGCAIEYVVERITRNPYIDSVFDYWDIFESYEPIKSKVLKIHCPKNLKPKWVVKNGEIIHDIAEEKDGEIYTFFKENVPRIIEEPAMPPIEDVATKLVISTANSWKDISQWYYHLCEPKLVPDSAIKEEVKDFLKDAKTKEDSLRSLYEFVKRNIRYVETKLIGKKGGYEPAPISFTYKNQYGVCRDKAALLTGMLREAGFKDAYMVLTNPMSRVEKEIPAPSQFNHAIVALKQGDGFTYFDPTAEWSVEFLLPIEDDREILVCTPEGRKLEKTPERPGSVNCTQVNVTLNLLKDRTGIMAIEVTGKGVLDMGLRSLVKMLPKERMKDIFLQSFLANYPKAVMDSIKTSDPEDYKTPMTLWIFMTIPEYATKIGKEWHIGGTKGFQMNQFGGGSLFSLEERKYPLDLQLKTYTVATATMTFPKSLKVKKLSPNFEKKIDDAEIKIETKQVGNKIISSTAYALNSKLIPSERYKKVKKMMEALEEYGKEKTILEER